MEAIIKALFANRQADGDDLSPEEMQRIADTVERCAELANPCDMAGV